MKPGPKSGYFYERYAFGILIVLFFLLPFALYGAAKARTNNRNDVKGWLPQEYEETRTYQFFRRHFQGEEFILVSWKGCTMSDTRLDLLAQKLLPSEEELARTGLPNFFRSVQTGPRAVEQMTRKPLELREQEAVSRLTGTIIGPPTQGAQEGSEEDDLAARQTSLVLTLSDAARSNLHGAIDFIRRTAVEECAIPEKDLHMGGPPVDNVAIDQAGQSSVTILFGLSLVVGFIVSWWSLRSWPLVLIVLASGVYAMFASLAIVWYSGYPVDAILLTMPSLVYVATTSGAIHLANYYRDQMAETGETEGAVDRSVHHALVPLALATGTTAIGLATLAISELIPIRMFGIFSAAGVCVSFLILVSFMPSLLEFFPPKLRVGKNAGDTESGSWRPVEESRWWAAGEWITRHGGIVSLACLAVMAFFGYGMFLTESSVQLMRLFSPQARIRQDYRWLESNLGQLVPMEILVRVDDEACTLTFLERMEFVDRIQRSIADLPEVGSSLSTVTFARNLGIGEGGGMGAAAARAFGLGKRAQRSLFNKQLLKHRDDFLAGDYLRESNGERNGQESDGRLEELWRVSARVSATKEVDYALFQKDLRTRIDPILEEYEARGVAGIDVEYTGLVPLVYKAQHSLLDGLVVGFITDFAIIVAVMVLLCRAASAGLVLLLPAAFPAVCVFGGMGWGHQLLSRLDLGTLLIDIGTVMAPSVALGVTVDDVVHFMLWFRKGIADGLDRREATMLAYKGCARAMYQSWGVIGIGLSVFSLSPFGPTQRFGHMMLSMLTVALVGNLVLLPALLSGPLGMVFGWSVRNRGSGQDDAGQRTMKADAGSDSLPAPHVLPGPAKQVAHA